MMSWKGWLIGLLIILAIVASGGIFTINQVEQGLIIRLGKVKYINNIRW